jgi:hypothetical protein
MNVTRSERIVVVPTVKAYPALLSSLDEAVCVAGFRTELMQPPSWIRLFPVHFRELEVDQQFHKWQEITINVERNAKDGRPESYKPHGSTIEAGRKLKPREQFQLVREMPHKSMCELMSEQALNGTSLGIVRPRRVIDVVVQSREPEEVSSQQSRINAAANRQKLFGPELTPLEVIPHRFLYRYLCESPDCGEHRQGIIDWEISAAYRKWRRNYPTDFIERIRHKWLNQLCGGDRDPQFFVGNMHQHPQSFLVLGVFWPKT